MPWVSLGHSTAEFSLSVYTRLTGDDLPRIEWPRDAVHVDDAVHNLYTPGQGGRRNYLMSRDSSRLRGRDSNPDYLIQSQASYH